MGQKSPIEQEESNFARRVGELRASLKRYDPRSLAERSGGVYISTGDQTGSLQCSLWGRPFSICVPDFILRDEHQEPASLTLQALVLYYLQTAHGPAPAGQWISFSELPDGKFYNLAFQGYSGKQLARAFGNNLADLRRAALKIGGQWLDQGGGIGDFACRFQVLPRLPVLLVGWQGDEEFPASYQFLFDVTAANYLPTDVCAIVGGILARKLIASQRE